jgi:hypothetical protein
MLLHAVINRKCFPFQKQNGSYLSGTLLIGCAFVPSNRIAQHLQVSGASVALPKLHPLAHCVVSVPSQVGERVSKWEAPL